MRQLRNISKILKLVWEKNLVLILLSRSNTLVIAVYTSQRLWIKYSTGESRYILILTLAQKLCEDIFKTILKIHGLTECYAASKIETKVAALKANYHLLASFWKNRRPIFLQFKLKNTFVLLFNQEKVAVHLMSYGVFFIQIKTKCYDLYHLLLICHVNVFLDHIISF